jgi:hypothetical protein
MRASVLFFVTWCAFFAAQVDCRGETWTVDSSDGLTRTEYESDKFAVGEPQSGLHYVLAGSAGPWTAPADNTGEYCESQTTTAGQYSKYSLSCNLLYALFSLAANWASEQVTVSSVECEGCCTGASCVIARIYIHETFNYTQIGWAKKVRSRVKTRASTLIPWATQTYGGWSGWSYVDPCESGYCELKTRSTVPWSCMGSASNNTYDPALRTGVPGCP